jgi:hypothetical protein
MARRFVLLGTFCFTVVLAVIVLNAKAAIATGLSEIQQTSGPDAATTAASLQPFQQEFSLTIPGGGYNTNTATTSFTVPTGNRLVIECVDSADLGSPPRNAQIGTTVNGNLAHYLLTPSYQKLQIYADPGTSVTVTAIGVGSYGAVALTVSGYLVPVK